MVYTANDDLVCDGDFLAETTTKRQWHEDLTRAQRRRRHRWISRNKLQLTKRWGHAQSYVNLNHDSYQKLSALLRNPHVTEDHLLAAVTSSTDAALRKFIRTRIGSGGFEQLPATTPKEAATANASNLLQVNASSKRLDPLLKKQAIQSANALWQKLYPSGERQPAEPPPSCSVQFRLPEDKVVSERAEPYRTDITQWQRDEDDHQPDPISELELNDEDKFALRRAILAKLAKDPSATDAKRPTAEIPKRPRKHSYKT